MKIENGTNLGVEYTNFIAISDNDTDNNCFIRKQSISEINGETNSVGQFIISIMIESGQRRDIKISDVTNQSMWDNSQAGLIVAVSDIIKWL